MFQFLYQYIVIDSIKGFTKIWEDSTRDVPIFNCSLYFVDYTENGMICTMSGSKTKLLVVEYITII